MARATVTIRELKNKDTGIDLSVTRYRETKGMIGSTYEYQIMVVSNLPFFKSAKHKETDNVQFTVEHKFADFEDLFTKMNTKFSGTVLPPLPKKVLMMSDAVARERRNSLDHFLKFLAMTPKLSTCSTLLEFLGVSPMKAGAFRKMEVSDAIVDRHDSKPESGDKDETSEDTGTEKEEADTNTNLFGDEDDADEDDDDMFGGGNIDTDITADTQIFDAPDLGGALVEGEDDDLFITDARLGTVDTVEVVTAVETSRHEEENDDLFRIDDDLDDIMKLNLKSKEAPKLETKEAPKLETKEAPKTETKADDSHSTPPEVTSPEIAEPKPTVRPKPAVRNKPPVPKRSDNLASKSDTQNSAMDSEIVSTQSNSMLQKPTPAPRPKPPLKQKPQLATKPVIKPRPGTSESLTNKADTSTAPSDHSDGKKDMLAADIDEDDIMKYIQDNTADETGDSDLFS